MDQRDSLDRSSSEAPAPLPASAAAPSGPGLNGASIPAGQMPNTEYETSPIVDSVLQSDVCYLRRHKP